MTCNFLLLNLDKTEIIVLGHKSIGNRVYTLVSSNTVFDHNMSFIKQIYKTDLLQYVQYV